MYRVINRFFDLQDNNHAYSVGDTFPHNGVYVDAERIAELASDKNRLGVPLIEEIAEKPSGHGKRKTKNNEKGGVYAHRNLCGNPQLF